MNVTEETVLKALVELRDSYGKTDYDIVAKKKRLYYPGI